MKNSLLFSSSKNWHVAVFQRLLLIPAIVLGMFSEGIAQSPGGVTGASVWLKADAGTSTTTDGSTIATWNDQSGNNRTHTQPHSTVYQPLYKDNIFNYNPAVYFDGLDGMQAAAFASGTDAVHVFAMSKVKDNGWRSIYGFGRDASHVQWYNGGGANKPSWWLSGNSYPSTALGLNYGVTSFILPKDGSQKTIHWNGTSANVTGINNYTYNSKLMGVGTDLNNFGNFSENFYGDIAEVIIYKKAGGGTMDATEIQKIQSYLGIKYGVTLSHNYLDATGATVYTLGTYNKNVFGIAREDGQGLYQKQSKSYDANNFVTLSTGALTTSNANNTGTLTNNSFEMVGDNGLDMSYGVTYAPTSFTPTTAFYRMSRVWQVQETGTVGTVRVTVPSGADRLLVSSTATFTPGASTQELTFTADGNGGQYVDIDLNNTTNKFFTFGKSVGAPGCVAGGLNLWLKADFGTSTTADGQDILQWEDASGNGNTHTKLSTSGLAVSPEFKTNSGFNFNPSVYFDGGYNGMGAPRFASGNDTLVVFSVSRVENTTNWGAIYSFKRDATHPQWRFGRPGVWLNANEDPHNGAGDLNLLYGINTFNLKRAAAGTNQDIWWNGNKTTYTGTGAYTYNATNFWMGNDVTDNGLASSEMFEGDIMEVAVYKNSAMTDDKIKKVQSYFGIKYVITVSHDYISGTGLTVWSRTTNTGYNTNIFGMGRDDCQDFTQKQSQSYSDKFVTIGNSTIIAATNAANGSSFVADKSFEIIGDNGLTKDYANTYTPTSFTPVSPFYRMNRVWKVQETGTVGTIRVSVPSSVDRLLVSSSNTFGAGTQEIAMVADGSGGYYADVDLTNGQFFTFGKAIKAPGCVITGLQYWYDAGVSVAGGASSVTDWTDKNSGVLLSKSASGTTGTITSSVGDAKSNFNPYVLFPANAHLTGVVDPVALGRLHTTFAVAQKDADINATYNHPFRFGAAVGAFTTHDFAVGTHLSAGSHYPNHHWLSKGSVADRLHSTPVALGTVGLYGARINSINGTSNKDVTFNGNTITYTDVITGNINANMQIGGSGYGMQGRIPEVAYYNVGMSNGDRDKVDSYFGIKYGLLLTHNYLSGTGTTVYDISTYGKNVFGIARDDCQDLNQKQSNSVGGDGLITLGIDNQIMTTNASNLGVFDTDKSFLLIGDNGATLGTLTTVTPGGACSPPESVDKFTSRVWKSVETGSVESAKLSVDLSTYGFSTVNPVYMQVSSDAAFTSFSNILMVKNGVNYETNYDFTGTQYVRFAGTTALPPANACSGDKTYEWNTFPSYWTWGQMSRTNTIGDTQFTVTITDPNNVIYAPSVYPVGQWWWNHIFIPRYDANGSANKITTKIAMDKAANKASFEIFDIDAYYGKDVVNVYGKLGGVQVNPKITFAANTKLTSTISGTGARISATTGAWDISAYGRAYVNFTAPVDEIVIEYTKDNGFAFKSYQDIRIRNIDIICKPFAPEAPAADNVYMSKQVVGGTNQKVDEAFTYKLTLTNLNCADKTINISDGLPSGLTFVDSTLSTSLVSTSVNAYGGNTSLDMTAVVVPPGTSYIYIDAKGMTAGSYDNQVDFTVGTNSYLSDDPAQTGASNPTPVTLAANRPLANLVITKTVDKATAAQNEVVKYTYVVTNPNASAILTTFQDNLPASVDGAFKYVAGSLTNIGAAIVSPTVYGGESSLTLRNLSIPASGSLTFTVEANTGTFKNGETGQNVASVTPDPGTAYRDIPYYSGQANTQIGACSAGTTAPTLSATTKSNVCPATTANISSLVTSTCPVGSTIQWHTVNTGLSAANKVADPTAVAAGTYYPACFDATNACYSIVPTTGVTVTIASCSLNFTGGGVTSGTVTQNATPGQLKSGGAAADLVPTGGTPGYTYSNGSLDPACVAPLGATALPGTSNLIVNTDGTYSYIAPAAPGTYYFCVKVCDSSTPTPVCAIATYKVVVAATCAAGTAIPVLKN